MYENHSRSPISNLNSRRIGWRARKKKVRPDETFSQSTKSIRCDMTQVTWKSPKEGTTHYARPTFTYPRRHPVLSARPRPPFYSSPKSILLKGGAGCAVNKCIEGRKEGSFNKISTSPQLGKKRVRRISRLSFCVQRACAV